MFSVNMVDYYVPILPLAVHLSFLCWSSRGGHSEPFLLFNFFFFMLKSYWVGWGGGVVAHEILFSAQRVWGQGLTIVLQYLLL